MRKSPFAFPLVLQCVLFLIPINIFVIGDWLATGVQWELFRYLQSYLGNSFIFFTRDINFITSGTITGRSALATGFNVTASAFLLIALCILLYVYLEKSAAYIKGAAIITVAGGCLFLLSDIIQYRSFVPWPCRVYDSHRSADHPCMRVVDVPDEVPG